MKKLILAVLIFVLGWDLAWGIAGVKPLFPWQLKEEYRKHNPALVLLDVRTPAEYNWFHISGAKNVPFRRLSARHVKIPKNKTVVVICMTGHRSSLVAYRLQKSGYSHVYNLIWGMAGWEAYKLISDLMADPGKPEPEVKQVSGKPLFQE